VIAGQSVLYNLSGWTIEEMVVKPSVAMHMNLPSLGAGGGRRGGGGGGPQAGANNNAARDQKMDELRKVLANARAYATAKEAQAKDPSLPKQNTDPVLENLIPVINGTMPVIFNANREADIRAAVDFAAEQKLKPIICGASEAWKAATYLKEKNVPVIYTGVFSLPGHEDDGYDVNYANAAALYKAGVKFCIATPFDAESDEFVRNLPYYAGQSAAFGLPKDEALKSVTLYPAQILGVGDKLGSIEEGKTGNVVLADGDILEYRTHVKQIFIAGKPVDMHNKHTDLYEKFLNRP
jgi:imidazolonepropionase-like amidohydrolase